MDYYGNTQIGDGGIGSLPSLKGTYYDLKNLQERHMEILRLLAIGVAKKDIATKLGISVAMIRYVTNSALGQQYLETIRGEREEVTIDIQQGIDELAAPAVNVIRQAIAGKMELELLDPDTGEIKQIEIPVKNGERIKTAQDILSRHSQGFSPRQRIQGTVNHDHTHNLGQIIGNVKERVRLEKLNGNGHQVTDAEIVDDPEEIKEPTGN